MVPPASALLSPYAGGEIIMESQVGDFPILWHPLSSRDMEEENDIDDTPVYGSWNESVALSWLHSIRSGG